MNTVRTKSQPWKEVEVSDAGLLDLQRRGSLAEDEKPAASPKKRTTPRKRSAAKPAATAATPDENKEG